MYTVIKEEINNILLTMKTKSDNYQRSVFIKILLGENVYLSYDISCFLDCSCYYCLPLLLFEALLLLLEVV
jgi:hypothetical protein